MDRPVGVWVVFLGYIAYAALGLGVLGYVFTHFDTLSPRLQAQYGDMETVDLLVEAGLHLVPVVGGVALVMLMRAACYIFALNLALLIGLAVLTVVAEIATDTFTGTGYAGTIIGIGIAQATHNYAWKLSKDGTLN